MTMKREYDLENNFEFWKGSKYCVKNYIFFSIFVILKPACGELFNPPTIVPKINYLLNKTLDLIFISTLTTNFFIISIRKFNCYTIFEMFMKRAFRI